MDHEKTNILLKIFRINSFAIIISLLLIVKSVVRTGVGGEISVTIRNLNSLKLLIYRC